MFKRNIVEIKYKSKLFLQFYDKRNIYNDKCIVK